MKNNIRTNSTIFALVGASLVIAWVWLPGCNKEEKKPATTGEPVEVREPVAVDEDKLQREFEETRREFTTKTRQQLDELDRKIQAAEARINEMGEDLQKEAREDLNALKEQRQKLAERLDQAEQTTRDAWERFEQDTRNAWNELEQAYNKALEKMQTEDNQ